MNLFMKSLLVAVMVAGFMVFFTTGCTKSMPEIEAGLKIPAPHFDKDISTINSFLVSNADGHCHRLITRIELKMGDSGWMDLKDIDSNSIVSCANDGKFHFTADFNNGYFAASKSILQAGGRIILQVRGFSEILASEVGQTTVSYGPAKGNNNIKIAATSRNRSLGGTGNYIVSGEVKPNDPSGFNANYFVRGSLRSK